MTREPTLQDQGELQDMFKAVLRSLRPATYYVVRDVTTGATRNYLLGRDGLLDRNDHVEWAVWDIGRDLHNCPCSVTLELDKLARGICVGVVSPYTALNKPYQWAGVSGQFDSSVGSWYLVVPSVEHLGSALADFVDRAYTSYEAQLARH